MAGNRAIRARRSHVLREVDGLVEQAERLRTQVRGADTSGSGAAPEIADARTLHPIIDRLESFLVQVKTLTQHRSKQQ